MHYKFIRIQSVSQRAIQRSVKLLPLELAENQNCDITREKQQPAFGQSTEMGPAAPIYLFIVVLQSHIWSHADPAKNRQKENSPNFWSPKRKSVKQTVE